MKDIYKETMKNISYNRVSRYRVLVHLINNHCVDDLTALSECGRTLREPPECVVFPSLSVCCLTDTSGWVQVIQLYPQKLGNIFKVKYKQIYFNLILEISYIQ